MRIALHSLKDELASQVQDTPHLSQQSHHQEVLQALDVLDAFVLENAALEFEEFLRRLQSLNVWHTLLANLDPLQLRAASGGYQNDATHKPLVQKDPRTDQKPLASKEQR